MKDTKLKYYLRGLGIGMLVTVLILGLAGNGEEPMTDAQIRERAIALGMVDADSLVLSELRENDTRMAEDSQVTSESTTEGDKPNENEMTDENEVPTETTEDLKTEIESVITESEEQVAEELTTEEQPVEEFKEMSDTITIEVRSGASSYSVSKDMEAAGLIEDAGSFDDYLCKNGYSKNIRVGIYEITVGTEVEEIAKIITGKR